MTNLTVAEVYAIGLPIIYGMIALEAIFSSLTNKSFYRLDDTLCTADLRSVITLLMDMPVS